MIYNGGILNCVKEQDGVHGALFIDDAYLLATGAGIEETHLKLKQTMEKAGGIFQWADNHNCKFGLDKFQLVDFTRCKAPNPMCIG